MTTRVLITGATGFVGSHLVDALLEGEGRERDGPSIRTLVRTTGDTTHLNGRAVEQVVGHLGDPSSLVSATSDVDVILHLAGKTRAPGEQDFQEANAQGTRRLLEAARETGRARRFVYVSSLAAVGPATSNRPVGIDDPPTPLTPYGRSKLEGERECSAHGGGMEVVVLRPPAVYGPRDRDLLIFFRMAAWGILPKPSGPTRRLQLIHVSDLARAIATAGLSGGEPGVYHVAEPRGYSWEEVLDLVALSVGRRARHLSIPSVLLQAVGEINAAIGQLRGKTPVFDRDKARELLASGWLCETDAIRRRLGFETRIPLREGLADTARWYREAGWLK